MNVLFDKFHTTCIREGNECKVYMHTKIIIKKKINNNDVKW